MFSLTDLKIGTKIIIDGSPHVVTFSQHSKQGRGGAIMRTKLKNLITGATIARTFQGSEKFEPAELEKKSAIFLYRDDMNSHLMDSVSFEQFEIENSHIGSNLDYLSENSPVEILTFGGQPLDIELPIKMIFKVVSAPPEVKGNSAGAITKLATISTGKQIPVPMFIKDGDSIIIDTRTGSYVERAS